MTLLPLQGGLATLNLKSVGWSPVPQHQASQAASDLGKGGKLSDTNPRRESPLLQRCSTCLIPDAMLTLARDALEPRARWATDRPHSPWQELFYVFYICLPHPQPSLGPLLLSSRTWTVPRVRSLHVLSPFLIFPIHFFCPVFFISITLYFHLIFTM